MNIQNISLETIDEILEHHGIQHPQRGLVLRDMKLWAMAQDQKPDSPVPNKELEQWAKQMELGHLSRSRSTQPVMAPSPISMPDPYGIKPRVTCDVESLYPEWTNNKSHDITAYNKE